MSYSIQIVEDEWKMVDIIYEEAGNGYSIRIPAERVHGRGARPDSYAFCLCDVTTWTTPRNAVVSPEKQKEIVANIHAWGASTHTPFFINP